MSFQKVLKRFRKTEETSYMDEMDTTHVTIHDMSRWFDAPLVLGETRPIIGNYGVRLIPTLAWGIKKRFMLMEGDPGSGKSEINNATIALLFGDDGLQGDNPELYTLVTASDKSQVYQQPKIEFATHAFVPELQNAENHFPMLKLWAEGKQFKRDVLMPNKEVAEFRAPPLPVLGSLAIGNEIIKKLPLEVMRRFMHAWTSTGEAINAEIQDMLARIRSFPDEELPGMTIDELYALRAKLHTAMEDERRVINPYLPAVQKYIPKRFTASNSYVSYFFDMIEAVTLFHAENRHSTDKYVFSTLADNFLTILITGDTFINLSLGIPDIGRELLNAMPFVETFGSLSAQGGKRASKDGNKLSVPEIMNIENKLGVYRDASTTEEIMEKLMDAGYLMVDYEGRKPFYYRVSEVGTADVLNWSSVADFGKDWMEKHFYIEKDIWMDIEGDKYVVPFGEDAGKERSVFDKGE